MSVSFDNFAERSWYSCRYLFWWKMSPTFDAR